MPHTHPTGTNAHVVLLGKERIEIQHRPIPVIKSHEVLVKVMATGLCVSTKTAVIQLSPGVALTSPSTSAAASARASSANLSFSGTRVRESSTPLAVRSSARRSGTTSRSSPRSRAAPAASAARVSGTTARTTRTLPRLALVSHLPSPLTQDGTLCQYYACPATSCVPLPPNLPWPQAGCIQPLAIAVQIGRRAPMLGHAAVGVMGCGPLGLLCMAVAKAYGAREIIGIDRVPERVTFALKYAATHAEVNPEKDMKAETHGTVEVKGRGSKIREVGDELAWLDHWVQVRLPKWGVQHGLDVVIDATGAEPCMQLAVALLRPGGSREP